MKQRPDSLLRWHRLFSASLLDYLQVTLLTSGLGALLLQLRSFDLPLWQLFGLGLALSGFVAWISRHIGRKLLIIGAIGGLAILIVRLVRRWPDLTMFMHWIYDWYQDFWTLAAPAPPVQPVLTAILLLPLALVSRWLVRHVDRLPVYLLLAAGGLAVALSGPPVLLPRFLLLLAAVLLQLPRAFSSAIRRHRPHDAVLPRAPMQWLALPVIIVSLVLAPALVPGQTTDWRLAPLANWLTDVQDLWANRFAPERPSPAFNLIYYGYTDVGYRLGGPVSLSPLLVLQVQSERAMLLRGLTRRIYTGNSWLRGQNRIYRLDSSLWREQQNAVFNKNMPAGRGNQAFRLAWRHNLQLQISHQQALATLFTAGAVQQISLPHRLNYTPYFTLDGDLFTLQTPPALFRYTVTTSWLDRQQTGFDQAMLAEEVKLAGTDDRQWAQMQADYLQLPDNLPAVVGQTARTVTADASTPFARALRLESYLRETGRYTLQPPLPPADQDFVAYFLADRRGTCVYYATALAVMARTLGIPARYVEGFSLDYNQAARTYQASGRNAHAWAELYFQGVGWLTFDATPAGEAENPGVSPTPAISVEPTPGPGPTVTPPATGPTKNGTALGWLLGLVALILLVVAGRLLLAYVWHRQRQTFEPAYIDRLISDPGKCLHYYFRDCLRQMACLDLQPEKGETLSQFAARAETFIRIDGLDLPSVFWPVVRLQYGAIVPQAAELARLAALRQNLELRLQANMTPLAYFWQRVWPLSRTRPTSADL